MFIKSKDMQFINLKMIVFISKFVSVKKWVKILKKNPI